MEKLGMVGIAVLWIYFTISQVMMLVFFIDICKTWDNLIEIIFLGFFWAEIKGLLWIFFI